MANRGINKVILIGYLGKDPEVRHMSNGGMVANLTLATSNSWKDKQTGENKERTEWHRVVLFGKLAEIAREYLRKGSQIYVEGSLQTRKWQDQHGQDRYTTEIIVNIGDTMQMLGNRSNNLDQDNWEKIQNSQQNHTSTSRISQSSPSDKDLSIDFDDDIPF